MKDNNSERADLHGVLAQMQSEFEKLQERISNLELGQTTSKKAKKLKKSKKKLKSRKSDPPLEELLQTIQQSTPEQLAATIVRYHKDPRQIAKKISRQRVD